jgi:hypothetical protein
LCRRYPKLLLGSCERQAQDEARSRDQTASEQAGYFTRAQSLGRGFTAPLITRHARTGRFLRIDRGLYRLRECFHGGACRVGLRIAGVSLDGPFPRPDPCLVTRIEHKSVHEPDEVRDLPAITLNLLRVGSLALGYATVQPGLETSAVWRSMRPRG